MSDSDPIVLQWEQEGLPALLRVLDRLDRHLEKIEESTEDVDKSSKDLTKTQKSLASQVRKNSRVLTTFGDALSGADRNTGRLLRTSGRMIGAFAQVTAVGGPAVAVVAGVGLAGAGAVAGVTAVGAATLEAAANAGELRRELEPFTSAGLFEGLSMGVQEADRLQASMDGVTTAFKGAGLALADEFSPEIEKGATLAVATGLAIADSAAEIRDFTVSIVDNARAVADYVREHPLLRVALGVTTNGLSEAVLALEDYTSDLERADHPMRNYIDDAREMFKIQTDVNRSLREAKQDLGSYAEILGQFANEDRIRGALLEANADRMDALTVAQEKNRLNVEAQIRSIELIQQKYLDNATVQAEAEDAITAIRARGYRDRAALADEEIKANMEAIGTYSESWENAFAHLEAYALTQRQAMVSGIQGSFSNIESAAGDLTSALSSKNAKAAKAMFRTQQAAAIANATMATAQAAAQSLAIPPGPPFSLAYVATAIAAGGAQIAAIASQPPPKVESVNHTGRAPIAPGAGTHPGERRASILDSEAVIPTNGIRSIVSALRAGNTPGGGGMGMAVVGPGHLDREMKRSDKGGTSRFARNNRRRQRQGRKGRPRY